MKSREELVEANIVLGNIALKFKLGLHLANKIIQIQSNPTYVIEELNLAKAAYKDFLTSNKLQGI